MYWYMAACALAAVANLYILYLLIREVNKMSEVDDEREDG